METPQHSAAGGNSRKSGSSPHIIWVSAVMPVRHSCSSPSTVLESWKGKNWGWPCSQLQEGGEVSAGSFCNAVWRQNSKWTCHCQRTWYALEALSGTFADHDFHRGKAALYPLLFLHLWCAGPWQPAFSRQVMPKMLSAEHFHSIGLLWLLYPLKWQCGEFLMQPNHWELLCWAWRGSVCTALWFAVLLGRELTLQIQHGAEHLHCYTTDKSVSMKLAARRYWLGEREPEPSLETEAING